MKKRSRLICAMRVLCFAAAGAASVPALAGDEQDTVARIARFVQGRLITADSIVYRAAGVTGAIDTAGKLYLSIDADPLYRMETRGGSESKAYGLFLDAIPANAKCGEVEAARSIDGTNFGVREGNEFVRLGDALRKVMQELPAIESSFPMIKPSATDLEKIRACARTYSAKADALPFESIQVYSRDVVLTAVQRTLTRSSMFEYGLGEETPVTRIVVTPKKGHSSADFSIEVRAVAVMHCDYEGPHLELDKWKEGVSAARRLPGRKGVFQVNARSLDTKTPKFPKYTQAELRRAIGAHFGEPRIATAEEAKPCSPFLRGHRFIVKHQSKVVHELSMYFPGGC
jgi:hypothetical protein